MSSFPHLLTYVRALNRTSRRTAFPVKSPMQIDGPDYNVNPSKSMFASPTLPSRQARFSILDESIKDYDDTTI